jgi:hypothetical protein
MATITVFLGRGGSGPKEMGLSGWTDGNVPIGRRVHEGDPLMPGEVIQYGSEYFRVESGDWDTNEFHARKCLSWPNARKIDVWQEVA